ncbi:MAG: MotA/TolQ/ExbB proton channel family protein [Ignavibacteria bacterium]|nr:MotA/TolQ/ExbB proton channel family protein [Ignavibacteria bacterium]
MSNNNTYKKFFTGFASIAIPIIFVISFTLYYKVLGNPGNFQGNNPMNHPLPGNVLGIVYKGGIIVPILMGLLLMVLTFIVERFITIFKAKGKGRVPVFVAKIHSLLSKDDVSTAIAECDKQRGSVANVVRAGLTKYEEMLSDKVLNKDQKIVAIKQEFEEATSLELPMLEQNLVILATIASIATLMGLLGTVIGMIKAFSALATAGAPDAVALANGISEALINTALGIGTSALAIIFYNFFTTQIDKLTYAIDEAGVAITQKYAAKHN